MCADNENNLLLKLNPTARTSQVSVSAPRCLLLALLFSPTTTQLQLPVNIYESLIEIVDGQVA